MSEEPCKWSSSFRCRFKETEGNEPTDVECAVCTAAFFRNCAEWLMEVVAKVGAGRHGHEFLEVRDRFVDGEKRFWCMVDKFMPWIAERAKERSESLGARVVAPFGLPKRVIEEMRKAIKEGRLPKELEGALDDYEKRGRGMVE